MQVQNQVRITKIKTVNLKGLGNKLVEFYCDPCYQKHKRILKKGEQRPPDYEQFIQCWECGTVYPLHQTFVEPEIKDSLETTSSPLENESIFLSTESRATQRRKNKGRPRSKRFIQDGKVDPDIQREIDKHGSDNVRVLK